MAHLDERTRSTSDPSSDGYDPGSPFYDVTADASSPFYLGPITGQVQPGDEIRTSVAGGLDLRSPGRGPRTVWANASHEQMQQVISANADASALAGSSADWIALGNELGEHQQQFGRAIDGDADSWRGEAGDAARTHLAGVAKWLDATARGAVHTGRQQEIHAQALDETQKRMDANPPVAFSATDANARLARMTDPVAYATQFRTEMDTYAGQQAARERAAVVMQQYDDTVTGAVATPRFAPPPPIPATPAQPTWTRRSEKNSPRSGEVPAVSGGTRPRSPASPATARQPGGTSAAATGRGVPASGTTVGRQGQSDRGGTSAAAAALNFTAHNGTAAGSFPAAGAVPGSCSNGNAPDGRRTPFSGTLPQATGSSIADGEPAPGSPGGGRGAGPTFGNESGLAVAGGGGRGSGSPNGAAVGARATGPSGRSGGDFGPTGRGSRGAGGSTSVRSGQSVTGAVEGGTGRAGGAPANGTTRSGGAGSPLGGTGAGGRGGTDEDQEYQHLSYLEGEEGIFAPPDVVAPPVIGDWDNTKDWR